MNELNAWIAKQARREQSVVRLEDALVANRFARYFFYRLRFLFARTAISTVIHAAKIVLLLGAFPRSEFLAIVIVQGSAALATDFWWGALEQMRTEVRLLQRRASRHIIPREIGRWLTLATRLAFAVGLVAVLYAIARALTGRLGAVDALVVALVIGASLDLVARTYHSGAYALRRVYRPLPSLLALDVVSVGVLLGLWPFVGIWAFPIAELLSVVVVAAISIRYTSRTYRTLALPTLVNLLRLRLAPPRARALRAAIAPGVSYALVGLEALIVIAGIATARTAEGATLVVLLAALAPVSRASFEWARLLYFDLKRLEMPLLADLRRRFDRAVVRVAVLMGLAGAAVATAVAVALLPQVTLSLVAALVLLFVVRSLLAAAQMQAFTRGAYWRLSVAGALGAAGIAATFFVNVPADLRIAAIAGALAVSLAVLLGLRRRAGRIDPLLSVADWLRILRDTKKPVTVTKLNFDDRHSARGTTREARRAEGWRRKAVANRLAARVVRAGGASAWVSQHELWTFQVSRPDGRRMVDPVRLAAGLLDESPVVEEWPDPRAAATALAAQILRSSGEGEPGAAPAVLPSVASLIADFKRRFPSGIVYDTTRAAPQELIALPSRQRAEVYRAAMLFARGLRRGRGPNDLEVTALPVEGSLRVMFVVDRKEDGAARRAWRHTLRDWTLRAAAGADGLGAGASEERGPRNRRRPAESDQAASEVAML
jgi:hypothetical protein